MKILVEAGTASFKVESKFSSSLYLHCMFLDFSKILKF